MEKPSAKHEKLDSKPVYIISEFNDYIGRLQTYQEE